MTLFPGQDALSTLEFSLVASLKKQLDLLVMELKELAIHLDTMRKGLGVIHVLKSEFLLTWLKY